MKSKNSYDPILNRGKSNNREFAGYVEKLRKVNHRKLDALFSKASLQAFEEIDCMQCGNCCRALGPKLSPPDMSRLASLFKMKVSSFRKQYTLKDEDGDFIFKELPCPWLESDNSCFIYDKRPKACRDYPRADQKHVSKRLQILLTETAYCPAVVLIFEYAMEMMKL